MRGSPPPPSAYRGATSSNTLETTTLSCPSADRAWRRACRSPRLASVMSFSTSGLTALALASVVLIRSCSMTSLQRFLSNALGWALSRLSLPRLLAWRIAAVLVVAQAQPAGVQGVDDLVDRLAAEVRDRGQLTLALGDQVADGLDACALEAVVGAHAELELLDEDVVHRAARLRDGAARAGADLARPRPVALQR